MNMNEKNLEAQLKHYFDEARDVQCPDSMKKNLYAQTINSNKKSWYSNRLVLAGVSMAFVATVLVKTNHNLSTIEETNKQNAQLAQAQKELNVAMHYMNRVSFKSLASVKNKGIQPAIIKPMAKSLASI